MIWLAGAVGVLFVGYLLGLLIGALYNTIAGWWGGIRLDLVQWEQEGTPSSAQEKEEKKEHTTSRKPRKKR